MAYCKLSPTGECPADGVLQCAALSDEESPCIRKDKNDDDK